MNRRQLLLTTLCAPLIRPLKALLPAKEATFSLELVDEFVERAKTLTPHMTGDRIDFIVYDDFVDFQDQARDKLGDWWMNKLEEDSCSQSTE